MRTDYPSFDDQWALAGRLAREALAFLELQDRRLVKNLSLQIGRAIFQYVGLKAAGEQWQPTKEQKEVLARLSRQLLDARDTINELNPEYRRAIGNLVGFPNDTRPVSLKEVDKQLADIAASTALVLQSLKPPTGRRPNHGLEAAVQRLLPLFEKLAGDAARISRDKPASKSPEPGSRSSAVLVHTIRLFPFPPSQTAILNMIDRVQQYPEGHIYDVEAEILRHFTESRSPSPAS